MPRVDIDRESPDFAIPDHEGREVRLSDFRGRPVVIIFNRGFV